MAVTTISSIPAFVISDHILPQLDAGDRRNAELSCKAFRLPSQMMRQNLVNMIVSDGTVSDLLAAYRIFRPDLSNATEVAAFLKRTVRHIDRINCTLPDDLRSGLPARVLVQTSDCGGIEQILTNGSQFTLMKKTVREITAIRKDLGIFLLITIVWSMVWIPYGASRGWKADNGAEVPLGRIVVMGGGIVGHAGDATFRFLYQSITLARMFSACVGGAAILTLLSKPAEDPTTTPAAVIGLVLVEAVLIVALRRFERRFC